MKEAAGVAVPCDPIETRSGDLGVDEFHAEYARRERPVILKGALESWAAFHTWTPEYLKSLVGKTQVTVARCPDGDYFDPETDQLYEKNHRLPFDRFLDAAFDPNAEDKLYLKQVNIAEFPALRAQTEVPKYIAAPVLSTNLWIGSAGNVTRAHYDMQDNFLAHLRGRKRVILFESRDLFRLYPCSPISKKANFARVDIEKPDIERFPRFAGIRGQEGVLEAGDLLYLPIHWMHQVYTLEAGVSLNYWWEARVGQALRPASLRYYPRIFLDGYLPAELKRLAKQVTARRKSPGPPRRDWL